MVSTRPVVMLVKTLRMIPPLALLSLMLSHSLRMPLSSSVSRATCSSIRLTLLDSSVDAASFPA